MNVPSVSPSTNAVSSPHHPLMKDSPASPDRLLRRSEVEQLVGLKRSTLYAEMAAGRFPLQVRLGVRSVAWRESEIQAWIASRPVVN